jgi:hypothetical protein
VPFAGGAAVIARSVAAVYADAPTALGSAVDVTDRHGATELAFFCDRSTGDTARRAGEFALAVSVIDPEGDFTPLAPAPPPRFTPLPDDLEPAAARIRAAGLDAEWEGGALLGEWLGLEVVRASDSEFDVGVGRHDRAANRELHPDGIPDEFVARAVEAVRGARRSDAPVSPVSQLAPERWLRAVVRRHPTLVGVERLRSGPPPTPRPDLRARSVAPAWADDGDAPLVIVFSVGVDPDLVPQAADARLQALGWPDFPNPRGHVPPLVLAVPEGDDHPLTRRLAALLRYPAQVITVPSDWRDVDGAAGSRP